MASFLLLVESDMMKEMKSSMKITKYGHACLLVEEKGVRILVDPGNYSSAQNEIKNIDIILITHEHLDHVDPEGLKIILANNPRAKIVTNTSVQAHLQKENIPIVSEIVEDGQKFSLGEVLIEGVGRDHAVLHSSLPCIHNTGYFINNLFHPGDAFPKPSRAVELLALPVAAPWMKVSEAIDYALALRPKKTFPIHDGMLKIPGGNHRLPKQILEPAGIPFIVMEEGKVYEF